jgi:carbon-monoxide dehydrogenase medium subunit
MKPAPFGYAAPTTVADAVALLAEHGDEGKVLAGGQSLVPLLALRLARPSVLVDINRIEGLGRVRRDNGHVSVGALVRHADVERPGTDADSVPLLGLAAPYIGHFQIRNRGTVCGSLTHADPSAEWPTVAVTLDAEVEVASTAGSRRIPARELFLGTFMTGLEAEDLVVATHFPVWAPDAGFAFEEFTRRSGDFAVAGAACAVEVTDGRVSRCALGLLGMSGLPLRAEAVELAVTGTTVDTVDSEELGRLAVAGLDPPGDIHASGAYRLRVGATLVARALTNALKEAGNA